MRTYSFRENLKDFHLPIVLVKPRNMLHKVDIYYPFAIDTRLKKSLIDPCLFDILKSPSNLNLDETRIVNKEYFQKATKSNEVFHDGDYFPFWGVVERIGKNKIKCYDGLRRECEKVKFSFDIDDQFFSDDFFIDDSLCAQKGKSQIQGILGIDFLRKHKWIIDFKESIFSY